MRSVRPELVFATIAVSPAEGVVAAAFWAQQLYPATVLTLLDVEVSAVDAMSVWLPTIPEKLQNFIDLYGSHNRIVMIGALPFMAHELALRGLPNFEMPEKLAAQSLPERALRAAGAVGRGAVKMAQDAFDKSQKHQYQALQNWHVGDPGEALADAFALGVIVGLDS